MSAIEYAKRELALVNTENDEMQNMMDENILEIIEVFSKQGHSGFSANYAINMLNRLLRFKPLKPLTGEDDEWRQVGDDWFQNIRYSSVFKEGGRAYWSGGRVFSDDGGETYYSNKDSRVDIEFPFHVPEKPEYVILEENQNG